MNRSRAMKLAAAAALTLALAWAALPVWAGGWAIVVLDSLPQDAAAGQPLEIGFTVRQHGQTLLPGLRPKITLTRAGELVAAQTVIALEDSLQKGHYTAALTLPSAGQWNWTIDAFGAFAQPMPPLRVGATETARAEPSAGVSTPQLVGGLGLLTALIAVAVLARTRAPAAGAVVLGALLLSLTGFAAGTGRASSSAPLPPSMETGQALFLAKGCIICHQLNAVGEYRTALADFSVGPNLSTYRLSPEYLRLWLKNPAAIKPQTQMPTLGLSDSEIEALVAFLDAKMGR